MSIKINLPATVVNTTVIGEQGDPDVTGLADGGFVVAWVSHTDSTAPSDYHDSDILGQRFDTDGNPVGAEFTINGVDALWDRSPTLAPTLDGGFVASWTNATESPAHQVQTGFFEANGTQVGDLLINYGSWATDYEVGTDTVALDDGRSLVLWTGYTGSRTEGVNGVIYTETGTVDVSPFALNSWESSLGFELAFSARGTALADGRFAVVFENTSGEREADGSDSVWLRLFEADGTPVGEEFAPNTTTAGDDNDPDIATLEDGGFVVVWQGWDDGSQTGIRAQVFNEDGTPRGGEIQVNTDTFGGQTSPAIVGLDDGGFMVTWTNVASSSGDGLMGQLFEADGTPRGVELLLSDQYDQTLGTYDSALSRLEDGRIAIVSTEHPKLDPDVFMGIFDPDRLIMGTTGDDRLVGTDLGDTLYGFQGDDTLLGRRGGDVMLGGGGTDTLSGGLGNDTLDGGRRGDTLDGGNGRDKLLGRNGFDLLDGGDGNDKLFGGNGNDTLVGGDGNDRLVGRDGNDKLWGEAGADTFVYEAGTDRVKDFDLAEDYLKIDPELWGGDALTAKEIVDLAVVEDGRTIFDFGDGDMLILKDITDTAALADALLI